jgi:hypothetical protein
MIKDDSSIHPSIDPFCEVRGNLINPPVITIMLISPHELK